MDLNDVLLRIDAYPDPTPPEAIEDDIGFVRLIDGTVWGLAVGVKFPIHGNRVADRLIGLIDMTADELARNRHDG